MILIDKEQTYQTLSEYYHHTRTLQHMALREALDRVPVVDAVPVRHGKWIDETFKPWGLVHHPFKCNLCGDRAEFASPYCPNCGARMEEE